MYNHVLILRKKQYQLITIGLMVVTYGMYGLHWQKNLMLLLKKLKLKASFGMNYLQFYELLSFISERRLNIILKNEPLYSFNKWCLGIKHCYFDLRQIQRVLKCFINDAKQNSIYDFICPKNEAELLFNKITTILNENKY